MPRPIDEILDDYRSTHDGPHIVQGSVLRRLVAEADKARKAADVSRETPAASETGDDVP